MASAKERAKGLAIVPLAFLVHNAEEAVGIPRMLPIAQAKLTSLLGPGATLPSANQYLVALAVLSGAAFVLWGLAFTWQPLAYVLLVLQATMAINVISHVVLAMAFGGYAPGVVTAVLVEASASVVVFRRVREGAWLSRRQWILLPILALLLHGPVALGLVLLVARA